MTTPVAGRSLELYYIDGRPDGMLTAEMFNWTGHVLMTPRTQIGQALVRPEAGYAGVYLLLGEQDGEDRLYVGESEDISARIRSHAVNKDWWTTAVLVTTAGNKLNKAHVRYLEARLVEEARAVGRTPLDNGTAPSRASLSEADVAKMEVFLENLLFALPALRISAFSKDKRTDAQVAETRITAAPDGSDEVRFTLDSRKRGVQAHALLLDGEFIVQRGSSARPQWESPATDHSTYAKLHRELVSAGVLTLDGETCVFTVNYRFASTSAAAAVVLGRPANGTTEWKLDGTTTTYKEWEARRLAEETRLLIG